ncbi:MAG: TolC family protein [Desulfobulbaceae bacterium]|nr:MAG: TolC family protein [Desulfobulbaceae bacterium]
MIRITKNELLSVSLAIVIIIVAPSCSVVTMSERDELLHVLTDQYAESADYENTDEIYWNESFTSQELSKDIMTLLSQNHDLEAAQARVKQAAAVYGTSKAELLPQVNINGSIDQTRNSSNTLNGSDKTVQKISFGGALSWEPDIWGRLQARKKAASLLLDEKQALSDQLSLNLQTLLVETWLNYQAARSLELVLHRQIRTNQQILKLIELRFTHGGGNYLDVLQQKSNLISLERALPGTLSAQRSTVNSYATLLGLYPGEQPIAGYIIPELQPLAAITSPRQLMANRPDLQAAFFALRAADHELAAAIRDRLPRLSIGLSYSESGTNLARIGDQTVFNFATGLLVPLIDAGRLQSKIDLQKAYAAERVAIFEQALINAIRDVENSLIQEKTLYEEYRLLKKELAAANATVREAELQYLNGQQTFLPVLLARAKFQTLQKTKILLKRDILINRGHLLKALGAKWSNDFEVT